MQKARFTETQIIAILREVESGMLIKDVCRGFASRPIHWSWRKEKIHQLESSPSVRVRRALYPRSIRNHKTFQLQQHFEHGKQVETN